MNAKNIFLGAIILALGLSSCAPSAGNAESFDPNAPRAWFDAPLPETVFYPPNPCQIVAHGSSPSGVALFELSINGEVTSIPSPDTQSSLVTLTQDCGLSEPGNYFLLLRAQDNNGNWSGYAETNFIIAGDVTSTASTPSTDTTATISPTPTITPTAASGGQASIQSVSTNLVYIGRASCGPLDVTITAQAVAPKGIKVVVLFFRFAAEGASSEFQSESMNLISGGLYQRTLNPTSLMGGHIPFDQATLEYQVVVQQNDGDTSLRTPLMADVAVQACGSVEQPPDCSSFTDEAACTSNGCAWVSIPAAVPLFACQNP